jgi:hypothetical protein
MRYPLLYKNHFNYSAYIGVSEHTLPCCKFHFSSRKLLTINECTSVNIQKHKDQMYHSLIYLNGEPITISSLSSKSN